MQHTFSDRILTHPAKLKCFAFGFWLAPAPPVCSAGWGAEAWVRWIDAEGRWLAERYWELLAP